MKKLIRDDKVGVVLSKGHGHGFFIEHMYSVIIFDPELILLVEKMNKKDIDYTDSDIIAYEIQDYINSNYDWRNKDWWMEEESYRNLVVEWVPVLKYFDIVSYDGHEEIEYIDVDINDFGIESLSIEEWRNHQLDKLL